MKDSQVRGPGPTSIGGSRVLRQPPYTVFLLPSRFLTLSIHPLTAARVVPYLAAVSTAAANMGAGGAGVSPGCPFHFFSGVSSRESVEQCSLFICLFIISVPGKCSTTKLALFVSGCPVSPVPLTEETVGLFFWSSSAEFQPNTGLSSLTLNTSCI